MDCNKHDLHKYYGEFTREDNYKGEEEFGEEINELGEGISYQLISWNFFSHKWCLSTSFSN